jgi:hypothetical protein
MSNCGSCDMGINGPHPHLNIDDRPNCKLIEALVLEVIGEANMFEIWDGIWAGNRLENWDKNPAEFWAEIWDEFWAEGGHE